MDRLTISQLDLVYATLANRPIGYLNKDMKTCSHEVIFRESIPRNSKWYCRWCFTEISNEALVMYDPRFFKTKRRVKND